MKRLAAILIYLSIGVGICGADLWTKDDVFRRLNCQVQKGADGKPEMTASHRVAIWPGKLDLEAAMNIGAFNGWFKSVPWLLEWISWAAVLATTLIVAVPRSVSPLLPIAFGFLAGGALGNLYDRLTFGGVRDFIRVYHGDWVWPNFNLADSAICTAVGLLILREIQLSRRQKKLSQSDPTATVTP